MPAHDAHFVVFAGQKARGVPSAFAAHAYLSGTTLLGRQRIGEGRVLLDRIVRNGDSAEARFLLSTDPMLALGECFSTSGMLQVARERAIAAKLLAEKQATEKGVKAAQ